MDTRCSALVKAAHTHTHTHTHGEQAWTGYGVLSYLRTMMLCGAIVLANGMDVRAQPCNYSPIFPVACPPSSVQFGGCPTDFDVKYYGALEEDGCISLPNGLPTSTLFVSTIMNTITDVDLHYEVRLRRSETTVLSLGDFCLDRSDNTYDYYLVNFVPRTFDYSATYRMQFERTTGVINASPIRIRMLNTTTNAVLAEKTVNPWGNVVTLTGTHRLSDLTNNGILPSLPMARMTAQKIVLAANSHLLIDTDYMFTTRNNSFFEDGTEIYLGAGAKITVGEIHNSVALDMLHTVIHGGCTLWDRIEVTPGSSLRMNHCEIEGGQYAIYLRDQYCSNLIGTGLRSPSCSSPIDLKIVNIEDCIYGIYTPDHVYSGLSKLPYEVTLEGVTIKGQDGLAAAFIGQTESVPSNNRPRAGIHGVNWRSLTTTDERRYDVGLFRANTQLHAMNVAMDLKDLTASIYLTDCYDLVSGIFIHQEFASQLNIRESTFADIDRICVHAKTSALTVVNSIFRRANKFIDQGGILGAVVSIKENIFEDAEHAAVFCHSNLEARREIESNTFTSDVYGAMAVHHVQFDPLQIGNGLRIHDNRITSPGGRPAAINLYGTAGGYVTDNRVRVNHGNNYVPNRQAIGLRANGTQGLRVLNNDIDVRGGSLSRDIHVRYAYASELSCNNSEEDYYDFTYAQVGMQVEGDCNLTLIRGNRLGGEETNLLYGPASGMASVTVGPQILHGNIFQDHNHTSGFEAIYNGYENFDVVVGNQYEVNQGYNNSRNWPDPVDVNNWFVSAGPYDEFECGLTPPSSAPPYVDLYDQVLDPDYFQGLVGGTLASGPFEARIAWTHRRQLYRYLMHKAELTSAEAAFLAEQAGNSVGAFEDYYAAIEDVVKYTVPEQQALMDAYDSWQSDWELFTGLLEAGGSLSQPEVSNAHQQYITSSDIYSSLSLTLKRDKEDALSLLSPNPADLPQDMIWEADEALMARLVMTAYDGEGHMDLSAQDYHAVRNLAHACAERHGPVVYRARAAYMAADADYDDSGFVENCTSEEAMRLAEDDMKSPSFARIFPNPASNQVYIEATDEAQITSVRCIGLDGTVHQVLAVSGHGSYDVSALTLGTYIVELQDAEGRLQHSLLTIVR